MDFFLTSSVLLEQNEFFYLHLKIKVTIYLSHLFSALTGDRLKNTAIMGQNEKVSLHSGGTFQIR